MMKKKAIFGLCLAAASAGAIAATDYYVVVPVNRGGNEQIISVELAPTTLPQGSVGVAYPAFSFLNVLRVTGDPNFTGVGVSWDLVGGSLPAGLVIDANGTLSGTPTEASSGAFTVQASYKGKAGQVEYQIVTLNIQVTLSPSTLEPATVGEDYPAVDFNDLVEVTGDPEVEDGGFKFSASNLPKGMTLSEQGTLSGIPSEKSRTGFKLDIAVDYKSKTSEQTYTLVVHGVPLAVQQVSVGTGHTCAVTAAGGVKCWGLNTNGQLGNNSTVNSPIPVDAVGLTSGVSKVYTSSLASCAVTSGGAAKCWGYNDKGQLGTGTVGQNALTVPTDVVGLSSGVTKIAVGVSHSCAVVNGGAKCWGDNRNGQLGDGTSESRSEAADVTGTSDVVDVSVGEKHSCLLTSNGNVSCWGMGGYDGTLGGVTFSATPVLVTTGIKEIASTFNTNCARTMAGEIKCWGSNSMGLLGVDSSTSSSDLPLTIPGVYGATGMSMTISRVCVTTNTQQAICWGPAYDGTPPPNYVPRLVTYLEDKLTQIAVSGNFACAVTVKGHAKCWGSNPWGQLGTGDTVYSFNPLAVEIAPQ